MLYQYCRLFFMTNEKFYYIAIKICKEIHVFFRLFIVTISKIPGFLAMNVKNSRLSFKVS